MFEKFKIKWKQFWCLHDGSRWSNFRSLESLEKLVGGQITREEYSKLPRIPDEHGCYECGKVWYV